MNRTGRWKKMFRWYWYDVVREIMSILVRDNLLYYPKKFRAIDENKNVKYRCVQWKVSKNPQVAVQRVIIYCVTLYCFGFGGSGLKMHTHAHKQARSNVFFRHGRRVLSSPKTCHYCARARIHRGGGRYSREKRHVNKKSRSDFNNIWMNKIVHTFENKILIFLHFGFK